MVGEQAQQRRKRISICIPAISTINVDVVAKLFEVSFDYMYRYVIDVMFSPIMPLDKARNDLVEKALMLGSDYVFFLDSDIVLHKETIDRLITVIETKGADLATALYFDKGKPYFPVLREYHSGGFWKVENPKLGELIQIAGCGMGACLIKTDVFRRLEKPWFKWNDEKWGYKEVTVSEDLYFCRKMMQAGMKLYCDTGNVVTHMGAGIDAFEYMSFAEIRAETIAERDELLTDLQEYTGLDAVETDMRIMDGPAFLRKEWNEKKPKTPKEVSEFYANSINNIYALFHWHFTERRQFDVELLTSVRENIKPKNILDFGCGIGQNAYMLAKAGFDVTLADIDGKSLEFALQRFKKHGVACKVWRIDKEEAPPIDKYDLILAFDVMEHIPDETFSQTVDRLIKLKHEGTQLMVTTTFGKNPYQPMHYELTEAKDADIQRLMLAELNLNNPKYWDELWSKEGLDTWRTYKPKFDRIIEMLNGRYKKKKRILDLGCGVGVLARRILNEVEGSEVHGLDISKEAVDMAVKADPRLKGFVAKFPDENPIELSDYYDVVIATEFVEHLTDEQFEKALDSVKVMLKKDGIFICSTPNNNMPKAVCLEHMQDFTPEALRKRLFKRFGFINTELVDCKGWEFILAFCEQ